jgi:large repetitive protein
MPNTAPAYTIGGITRPELFFDANGNIVLTPAAEQFAETYGLKLLYIGLPANTPYPPVADSLATPTDSNAAANSVAEGAAVNTPVNLTVSASSAGGLSVTYSLVGDTSGGGFKIDPTTGVVTVADPTKIDFETSPGHAYSVTAQANDGIVTTSQTFTINVTDVAPSTPVDANAAANTVAEGAAVNTLVGITASSADVNGPGVTYSLVGDTSGGGFKIDPVTGVVSVADPTKIDYESSPGHAYTITAQASDGTLSSTQTFTIAVSDVPLPAPTDVDPATNTVVEGATAGTHVGITASAIDPNGPVTHYSLTTDSSGGGFTIDPNTGVVTVADPTKIDFESTAPGHTYSITVQANDGIATTSQSFNIAVSDVAPSAPVDNDATANSVVEGAAVGTTVGVTAHSTDVNGPAVTYSLIGDTSGGGFTINATTGVVTVADPTKIDYETAPGHDYTITAQASDGTLTSSQTFTIGVTDVAPSTPVDSDATADTVVEGAAAGTTVGVTVSSTDVNGPPVTYSLTGDTSGGGFTINATTGVITVADPTKIDFESSGAGHSYTVIAQASDGTDVSSQTFTIGVTDAPPSTPVDSDATANSVVEGAANGSTVGVTASSTDVNGPAVTYSLTGDTSGGGFTINATTGVVTVADPTKIDYESSPGHAYTVTAQASDGTDVSSQTFTIAVTDAPPSTPVDSDATANSVVEGAANGTTVGVTASSTDVNGPAVTYSLTGDTSGGGFTINAVTGVVTVADSTKIDYESAPGHAYTVTAQASDGTDVSSQTFTIGVTDAPPSTPVDSDATADTVVEGAAAGTTVGITASSTDVNGPPVTYSLVGDTSGGGFTINSATGVVTVADPTKIDFESSGAGHSYTVTAQASDGTDVSSQTFTIAVTDAPPSTPVDSDATANSIVEGAANGSTVGVTASSIDVNGPAVTYSLTGDTSGGGFTINATTGVITVADSTKIDFESTAPSHTYTVTATASDGTDASSQNFTINVTDAPPSTPVDSDGTINQVSQNAPDGTYTGLTASSTDVNGPAVTYSLVGDTSGGGFTVDASTGKVTVADSTKIPFNAGSPSFDVTVQSSDGTDTSQQTFTINVIQNTPPVANDDSLSATEAGGLNNSVPGSNPSGNVVLGTGSAGAVQDTDAQDPSTALTVVAVHTGAEGASTGTGTVGSGTVGLHGTLTLDSNGAYTYTVNQSDAQVQALHISTDTITDVFNYTIQDTGGLQDTASITITIHGADDLPQAVADTGTMTEDSAPTSFNVIANDTQDPDHTAANTITVGPGSITVTGPAGETFANTDATASIVSNQVQVTLVNADFQQLAVGQSATVTVPYTLTGDVGETSSANLVVTVNGVNDVPVAVNDSGTMTEDQSGHAFTVLANDTLDPDHGAPNNVTVGTVANLVAPSGENIDTSDISVSVNGSNQVVVNLGSDFQHMQDGQTATFDIPYTLHGDQAGDVSSATLHVTVTGVNDAPVAGNFTFTGVDSATGNTDLIVHDPANAATTETTPDKTISASLLSGASDVDGPGPLIVVAGTIATAHGGSVTMQSDGDFIYKPPVGYTGSDSFNYQVSDQNTGASGVGLGTGTVTLNVDAPKVWYVDANAAAGGDGSSEHPFNDLSHLGTGGVDGAGDTIFLEGSGETFSAPAGGLQLHTNEQLISQSNGLTVPDGGGTGGTVTLVSASGSNDLINGGVILGSGNNIQGVNFGTSTTFALSGANVGTVHVDDSTSGTINNSSGGGVSITGTGNALNMNFTSLTSGAGTNGITINGASGTFHAHGGTISGASGSDVALNASTLNFTDDGAISDSTGTVVSISNMTAGTQSFTGAIGTTGSTDGAISLSSNTGATMSFSGGMALSTGTANAFSASGGGTVNVTGTNHLTTTTGTALDVVNTNIGTSGITFHDISANGGTNGMVLNNTGTSGGLTVTGSGNTSSGGDSSGGTIQSTTGDGIVLTSTSNVSLADMNVHNTAGDGINGTTVNGFTLSSSTFTTDGTSVSGIGQGDVYFTGLSGSASVTNSKLTGAAYDAFHVFNDSAQTLNRLTLTGDTFATNSAAGNSSNSAVNLEATGGTFNATVTGSDFNSSRNDMFHLNLLGTVSSDLVFGGSTAALGNTLNNSNLNIASGAGGIDVGGGGTNNNITLTYEIAHNTISGASGADIAVSKGTGTGASFSGTIDSNTIGTQGVDDSGSSAGDGIFVGVDGAGTSTTTITNNQIHGVDEAGIHFLNENGSGKLNATIQTNTIDTLDQNDALAGMYLQTGANGSNDNNISNLTIGGAGSLQNSIDIGDNNNFAVSADIVLLQNGSTKVGLPGYPGTPNDTTAVQNFVTANNNFVSTANAQAVDALTHAPGGYFGTAQLLAADGGVASASGTPGETNLTQAELDSVVAAAIADWAAAGASASQLAALHATTFSVANLGGTTIGEETPGHIVIDTSAAGHGWYIDPTPSDNSEFTNAQNAAGTDLLTDPSNAAAGHMDLLTAVMHELGHVIGLPDTTAPADANDLMYINLVDGERKLPDAADVGQALVGTPVAGITMPSFGSSPTPPSLPAPPPPFVTDSSYGASGSVTVAAADHFVFASNPAPPAAAQPIAHVVDYSAAQGDTFDFSALTSAFHTSNIADASLVRAMEDPSGTFATLQFNTNGDAAAAVSRAAAAPPSAVANWVDVAQIDGAHAGDPVNVLVDSHAAIHLAQIHATLLV